MKKYYWALLLVGIILVIIALWQLLSARSGLYFQNKRSPQPPITYILPKGDITDRPLVLIAHGFSGSRQIMYGFGYTLAHAGFPVLLWDFDGHGASHNPMPVENWDALLNNAFEALEQAQKGGLSYSGEVAILGHSMGSGVAMSFGVARPDTGATVAVSPTGAEVSPTLPRNMLLMAGSLEAPFLRNAQELLEQAGGVNSDIEKGTARALKIIDNVEHISILFSPTAHRVALNWIEATYGAQPGKIVYTDHRMLWWTVGLIGMLTLNAGAAGFIRKTVEKRSEKYAPWRGVAALLTGALVATLLLMLLGKMGIQLRSLFGILVGGYVLVWFAVAGLVSMLILRIGAVRIRNSEFISGLVVFIVLWLGAGLLGHISWINWILNINRLIIWPLASLLLLPWFYTIGVLTENQRSLVRAVWWLISSLTIMLGLFLGIQLTPEIGFLMLIMPAIPLLLALHMLAATPYKSSWSYTISGALWISWALLAVFPIQ